MRMDERKVLTDTLKHVEKPIKDWSWPAFLFQLVVWLPIAAAGAALFMSGLLGPKEWLVLAGTFIAGAMTAALGIYSDSTKRWVLVRNYIDVPRIQARLRDLGA